MATINPIQLIQGAARELVNPADVAALRGSGVLVEDPRRERPRYFDGRFLAARDLIRDQQYFLTREADLGRAAGSGVAHGLEVSAGSTPSSLRITAGEGITPAGELVLLPQQLDINLANIPAAELLSAKFGLARIPNPPARSRTGLYVLALRPVEFTANPVGAYPTSLTGPRTVEDGDVIEATALVLVPWQDDGAADSLQARRGRAARTIFTQEARAIASANVLPVAMLALQSNTIVWIDEALVRRELGADRGDLPGLGFAPRGLRMAHLMQHQAHLADVVAMMSGRSFPAATQFPALPPAGPLPPGVIDTRDFTQRYFPTQVDVDFSIVPDDELPALVEEALALPPIDFLSSEAALDLTAVLILAPVPRADFRSVLAKLNSRTRLLKPAAPNLVAQRKPLEILQRLRLPLTLTVPDVANPSDAEWTRLANLPTLWYVRRRNLAYRDDLVGNGVAATGTEELALESAVTARMASLGLTTQFNRVMDAATSKAAWSVVSLLAMPHIVASPTLSAAAVGALQAKINAHAQRRLTNADALSVGNELNSGTAGTGLLNLETTVAGGVSPRALVQLASNDAWRKLDATASRASGAQLTQLGARLAATPPAAADGGLAVDDTAGIDQAKEAADTTEAKDTGTTATEAGTTGTAGGKRAPGTGIIGKTTVTPTAAGAGKLTPPQRAAMAALAAGDASPEALAAAAAAMQAGAAAAPPPAGAAAKAAAAAPAPAPVRRDSPARSSQRAAVVRREAVRKAAAAAKKPAGKPAKKPGRSKR
jgi:hypothetical protein